MKNILSDIYQGNYTVHNHKNRKGTPFAETMDRIEKLEEEIRKALPEGSKAAFDEYVRARADLSDMACEEDFVAGYQLGVRMMLAGISEELSGIGIKSANS